jgi:hypothetical protein
MSDKPEHDSDYLQAFDDEDLLHEIIHNAVLVAISSFRCIIAGFTRACSPIAVTRPWALASAASLNHSRGAGGSGLTTASGHGLSWRQ